MANIKTIIIIIIVFSNYVIHSFFAKFLFINLNIKITLRCTYTLIQLNPLNNIAQNKYNIQVVYIIIKLGMKVAHWIGSA